jgi:hypothetical protein
MFHLNVTKVNLDIAYVTMSIYICFNRMFHVFILNVCVSPSTAGLERGCDQVTSPTDRHPRHQQWSPKSARPQARNGI